MHVLQGTSCSAILCERPPAFVRLNTARYDKAAVSPGHTVSFWMSYPPEEGWDRLYDQTLPRCFSVL